MKIICEGIELSDAVMKTVKACSTKTTNPILECIKLSAENDVLTLLATDGEIAIERKIKAEVLEEGAVCVPGKYFSDFIKKLENAQICLGCEGDKLNIKYILPLLDAGYDVEIACTRADAATCANRVVARAIEGGVFIPREVVMGFDDRAVLGAYNEVLATDYGGKRVKRSKYSEIK